MSGWSTLTVELRDSEEYWDECEAHITDDAQDTLHDFAEEQGLQIFSGTHMASNYDAETGESNRYLVAVIGGYRDWAEDTTVLDQLGLYTTGRAVVIHANDTSDTGEARLYKHQPMHGWEVKHSYEETQSEDGTHVGMKAASVMHARHGIPAVAKTNPLFDHSERDGYSEKTVKGRPR